MTGKRIRLSKTGVTDLLFNVFNSIFNILFSLICIYPFYYLFLTSVSDSDAVYRGDVVFLPVHFNLFYYKQVFELKGIFQSFVVSSARAVIGTCITLFFTAMLSYVVTKKEFKWRKIFYRMTIITMYANAGLIPWVVSYSMLGFRNSFLLYVLPGAVSAFGMVLVKTYIEQLPAAVEESAVIDGAGYFTVFLKIIIPLSMPVIAALGVFAAVGQWNNFQDNFFLVQDHNLQTMQLILYNYLQSAERMASSAGARDIALLNTLRLTPPSPFTIKATIAVISILPILVVYPLLQKYFVKGIMLGAVKG